MNVGVKLAGKMIGDAVGLEANLADWRCVWQIGITSEEACRIRAGAGALAGSVGLRLVIRVSKYRSKVWAGRW